MLVIFQALQTIGFYGFANWAPTFLLKRGVSLLHSLEYALMIALIAAVCVAVVTTIGTGTNTQFGVINGYL